MEDKIISDHRSSILQLKDLSKVSQLAQRFEAPKIKEKPKIPSKPLTKETIVPSVRPKVPRKLVVMRNESMRDSAIFVHRKGLFIKTLSRSMSSERILSNCNESSDVYETVTETPMEEPEYVFHYLIANCVLLF